jgi:hypothetical protein
MTIPHRDVRKTLKECRLTTFLVEWLAAEVLFD